MLTEDDVFTMDVLQQAVTDAIEGMTVLQKTPDQRTPLVRLLF